MTLFDNCTHNIIAELNHSDQQYTLYSAVLVVCSAQSKSFSERLVEC